MKKAVITFLILVLITPFLVKISSAQSLSNEGLEGFMYQAELRNEKGRTLSNTSVLLDIRILDHNIVADTDDYVWQRNYDITTDKYGMISVIVGDEGTQQEPAFSSIEWGTSSLYLHVAVNDGSGWVSMGAPVMLMSVPYALYAKSAGEVVSGDISSLITRIDELESNVAELVLLIDKDQDGYSPASGDCDDNDNTVYPGAVEICDDMDNDCDDVIDEVCHTDVYIELTWDTPADPNQMDQNGTDLDLHLKQTQQEWESIWDCYYANPNPDWGFAGPDGDPSLELDDSDGKGPEIISFSSLENIQYTLGINYINDAEYGASFANVKIFVYGNLQFQKDNIEMGKGDFIAVAIIENNSGSIIITEVTDADGDGFTSDIDCNDLDASIYPSAPCDDGFFCTVADAYDDDCNCIGIPASSDVVCFAGDECNIQTTCDGVNPECPPVINICDIDNDGDNFTINQGDCDDNDDTVYPGAEEICDGKDNNCDGDMDEVFDFSTDANNCGGCGQICLPGYICISSACVLLDVDRDGYGSTEAGGDDCNDHNASVYPGQTAYFSIPISLGNFDYDCNTQNDRRWNDNAVITKNILNIITDVIPGWSGNSIPQCGTTGTYVTGFDAITNQETTEVRTQECR